MSGARLYRLAWVFYLLMAFAGVAWIGVREEEIPLALFVDLGHWWLDGAVGLGTGVALLAAWWLAERQLPGAQGLEERMRRLVGPLERGEILGLALISGFAEEFFFRGAVQGSWGPLWAAALFALLHSGPGREYRLWTLFAAAAGLAFGGLVWWRGNLLPAVCGHVLFNAMSLRRLATRRESGGEQDPLGSQMEDNASTDSRRRREEARNHDHHER